MCYTNRIFYGLGQGVSGLGRWRLQADKFLNFTIPVPSYEEQKEIELLENEFTLEVIPYEGTEEPTPGQGGNAGGGMSCSFGGYYVSAFIGACALLLLVSKKHRG